ncbi:MAG: sugar ABC transporter substrate-binding protein [Spirochaetaceae bacterium]
MRRVLIGLFVTVLTLAVAFPAVAGGQGEEDDGVKIGLSFGSFALERWPREQSIMTDVANEMGAQVISQVANNDPKLQNDQIENMVLQGVDVLIIVAEDAGSAVTAVNSAAEAGVEVISYDRLIPTENISVYMSFDNVQVGRVQAEEIVKRRPEGKYVLLGGSPTDNNATLFRQGQMDVLQPLIDDGDIEVVADQWVPNWDGAEATRIMEDILTAEGNDIDAVVASNDSTALGAIQALEAQGLAGEVPISGQDATAAGVRSIVNGNLTMSVLKDYREMAPRAVEVAMELAQGGDELDFEERTLEELTLEEDMEGSVNVDFRPVVAVHEDNVYEEVVETGFQDWEEVYSDVPEDERPPQPE